MARLLTLAEAATRLGLSPSTLRHQAQAGRLKAQLVGKTYVVSDKEIERYRRDSLGKRRGFTFVEDRALTPDEAYRLADALAPNPRASWRPEE